MVKQECPTRTPTHAWFEADSLFVAILWLWSWNALVVEIHSHSAVYYETESENTTISKSVRTKQHFKGFLKF